MKKCFTFLSLFIVALSNAQFTKHTLNNNAQKVFIENQSQFDAKNDLCGNPILFATETSPSQMLFTKTGMTFYFEVIERPSVEEREERKPGMTHEIGRAHV